jgi:hypothetical protein
LFVKRRDVIAEAEVGGLLHKHGFSVANLSSRLTEGGKQFEYRMVIRSKDRNGETLEKMRDCRHQDARDHDADRSAHIAAPHRRRKWRSLGL